MTTGSRREIWPIGTASTLIIAGFHGPASQSAALGNATAAFARLIRRRDTLSSCRRPAAPRIGWVAGRRECAGRRSGRFLRRTSRIAAGLGQRSRAKRRRRHSSSHTGLDIIDLGITQRRHGEVARRASHGNNGDTGRRTRAPKRQQIDTKKTIA